eukprot:m.1355102 g.1355102  ORF g.1355102 m.1355102 type:complete len:166 (-) comp24932_c0_seq39:1996-2493(-)
MHPNLTPCRAAMGQSLRIRDHNRNTVHVALLGLRAGYTICMNIYRGCTHAVPWISAIGDASKAQSCDPKVHHAHRPMNLTLYGITAPHGVVRVTCGCGDRWYSRLHEILSMVFSAGHVVDTGAAVMYDLGKMLVPKLLERRSVVRQRRPAARHDGVHVVWAAQGF